MCAYSCPPALDRQPRRAEPQATRTARTNESESMSHDNILAEQVLGLPPDIRADKGMPFNKIPTGKH